MVAELSKLPGFVLDIVVLSCILLLSCDSKSAETTGLTREFIGGWKWPVLPIIFIYWSRKNPGKKRAELPSLDIICFLTELLMSYQNTCQDKVFLPNGI